MKAAGDLTSSFNVAATPYLRSAFCSLHFKPMDSSSPLTENPEDRGPALVHSRKLTLTNTVKYSLCFVGGG